MINLTKLEKLVAALFLLDSVLFRILSGFIKVKKGIS